MTRIAKVTLDVQAADLMGNQTDNVALYCQPENTIPNVEEKSYLSRAPAGVQLNYRQTYALRHPLQFCFLYFLRRRAVSVFRYVRALYFSAVVLVLLLNVI